MKFNFYWTADGWCGHREHWDASGWPHKQDAWSSDGFIGAFFLSPKRFFRRGRR